MGAAVTAFIVVFVAELGDRTQLLLLALATRHRPLPVLGGLLLGYSTMTLVAVALGAVIGNALPETAVTVGSGLVFLGFAGWTVLGDDHDTDDRELADHEGRHPMALMATIAGAVMLSEIGDKSMLATATLATEGDAIAVWLGATLGIVCSGALGVAAGRLLAEWVNPTFLRWTSAGLFAAFGVAMLVRAL